MRRRGSGRKEQAERCKDNGRIDSAQKCLLKRLDLQLHEVGQSNPCKAARELIDFTSIQPRSLIEGGNLLRYFTQIRLRGSPPPPGQTAPSEMRAAGSNSLCACPASPSNGPTRWGQGLTAEKTGRACSSGSAIGTPLIAT